MANVLNGIFKVHTAHKLVEAMAQRKWNKPRSNGTVFISTNKI